MVVERLSDERSGAAVPDRSPLEPRRRRTSHGGGGAYRASRPHGSSVRHHLAFSGKLRFGHDLGACRRKAVDLGVEVSVPGDNVEASAALELHGKLSPRDIASVVFAFNSFRGL